MSELEPHSVASAAALAVLCATIFGIGGAITGFLAGDMHEGVAIGVGAGIVVAAVLVFLVGRGIDRH